jgi:hypothetical protein
MHRQESENVVLSSPDSTSPALIGLPLSAQVVLLCGRGRRDQRQRHPCRKAQAYAESVFHHEINSYLIRRARSRSIFLFKHDLFENSVPFSRSCAKTAFAAACCG